MPCAGVQILHKDSLVLHHRLNTAPLPRRLYHTPLLLPIQTLHIVILKRERGWSGVGGGGRTDLSGLELKFNKQIEEKVVIIYTVLKEYASIFILITTHCICKHICDCRIQHLI